MPLSFEPALGRREPLLWAIGLWFAAFAQCLTAQTLWNDGFEDRVLVDLAQIPGQVQLPAGLGFNPRDLTVENLATAAAPVDDAGGFQLLSSTEGRQLAAVVGPDNQTLLLGFFGPDGENNELSAATTAEVLLFFSVGGSFVDAFLQQALLSRLRDSGPAFDTLVSTLAEELAGDPNLLINGSAALTAALNSAASEILAPVSGKRTRVNPVDSQSGQTLIQGFQRVSVQNSFRRPAILYLDRVSCDTDQGEVTAGSGNCPTFRRQLNVAPIGGVRTSTDAIGDAGRIIVGLDDELPPAWVPTLSDPVITGIALGTQGATYQVQTIGPGSTPGVIDTLSDERRQRARQLNMQFITTYFVAPFLANLLAPLNGETVDGILRNNSLNNQLMILLLSSAPLQSALDDGDFQRAGEVAIRELALGSLRDRMTTLLIEALALRSSGARVGPDLTRFMRQRVANVTLALRLVDLALSSLDVSVAGQAFRESNAADEWEVNVIPESVSLSAISNRATCTDPAEFQARVNAVAVPTDVVLRHRFSVAPNSGVLIDPDNGGVTAPTELLLDSDRIRFLKDDLLRDATVSINVDVEAVAAGVSSFVGRASAIALIDVLEVAITPRLASLSNGDQVELVASVRDPRNTSQNEDCLSGAEPAFEWSSSSSVGTLDIVQGTPIFRDQATYVAGSTGQGTDTVSVTAYISGEQIGEATAQVRVEDTPSVVFGSLAIEVLPQESDSIPRSCVIATVVVPDVPGAQSFNLRGYNGYDPFFYGTTIFESAPPFFEGLGFGVDYSENDRRMFLSSTCGPTDVILSDWVPYHEGRFQAPPWIWEIGVGY